jgi:hypothetical protein
MEDPKFTLLYKPQTHNGKPNTSIQSYQIFMPEEGFGNNKDGKSFVGFKARKVEDGTYRSFRWDGVHALMPSV